MHARTYMHSCMQIFRITRMLGNVGAARTLRTVIECISLSVTELVPTAGLLGLLIFLYTNLGKTLFYNVRNGESINEYANFRTFWDAMMVLFRCITGDNWDGMMYECAQGQCDDIDPRHSFACGNPWSAYIYFYSFMFVGFLIMVNVIVGIVLEQLDSYAHASEPNPFHPQLFASTWAQYDPEARGRIPANKVESLLGKLPVLGLSKIHRGWTALKMQKMLELHVPIYSDGSVAYIDVFEQLAQRACGFSDVSEVMTANR